MPRDLFADEQTQPKDLFVDPVDEGAGLDVLQEYLQGKGLWGKMASGALSIAEDPKGALYTAAQMPTMGATDEIVSNLAGLKGITREQALEELRQPIESFAEENPKVAMALNLPGALVSGFGGAKLIGKGAQKFAPRALDAAQAYSRAHPIKAGAGLAFGGGYPYGLGTAEGDFVERQPEALTMGAVSMPFGSSIPIAASAIRGIRPHTQKVVAFLDKLKGKPQPVSDAPIEQLAREAQEAAGPSGFDPLAEQNKAFKKVEKAIRADFPDNAEEVFSAWKRGELSLSELGTPRVRSLQKGAAQYPKGQARAEQFFDEKISASPERIEETLTQAIAPDDMSATIEGIVKKGRLKAEPQYAKAYDQSVALGELPKEVQTAIAKARRQFPSELEGLDDNSVKVLDYAKRVLDDDINTAQRAGKGNLVRNRTQIKNDLLNTIDEAVPEYKEARRISGDYLSISDAGDKGSKFMREDVEVVRNRWKGFSDSEKESYLMGVRKSMSDLLSNVNEGANSFNRLFGKSKQQKKLMEILPPKEFQALEQSLRAENKLFKMRNEVLGGSPTTSKAIAAGQIGAGIVEAGSFGAAFGVASVPRRALVGSLRKMIDGLNDKTAGHVASILYETDPVKKLAIINGLNKKALTPQEIKLVKDSYFQAEKQFNMTTPFVSGLVGSTVTEE